MTAEEKKAACREYNHKYHEAHFEERHEQDNERHRQYYAAHREQAKARQQKYCKEHREQCNEQSRNWKRANPDKVKVIKLKNRYGLTTEAAERLLTELKSGVCAICGSSSGTKPLVVDHDHVTGIVRGVLCNSCNLGLGHFEGIANWHDRLAQYLNGGNKCY
jgi:hypothetical protein